ncbi:Beta-galactosidase [Toxocara canis]|uniref:Beta-galactosidase n=1 Tax=Toxocara canis TaxID=6265 RepID=A0A0B2UY78_TOXCA|nr:Beta-galactosidase [Toxocara canis]
MKIVHCICPNKLNERIRSEGICSKILTSSNMQHLPLVLTILLIFGGALVYSQSVPSFTIDRDNKQFLLDGKPFRYISGSIHYFRVHPDQWNDRLFRMRAAGLNAIQFYIPWNFHEVYEGKPQFEGSRNITRFLQLAMQNELYALVRIGPFTCGEWESGGHPWWLLKYKDIKMRTSDERYLAAVKRWFDILLPMLKPSLRKNGGPILMLQLENEYGSFSGCDRNYTAFLRDLAKSHFGDDVVLYTTDGGDDSYLKCGTIPGVFATVDFGPTSREGIEHGFAAQRHYEPNGPLVNSEYYPGWFLLWNQKQPSDQPVHNVINGSMYMFELGASFNYYMFHGGTNFAFWNGGFPKTAVTTSYDYFAPLSEAADVTDKYIAVRDWIKTIEHWPNPPKTLPKNNPKTAYGVVPMRRITSLVSNETLQVASNGRSLSWRYPLTFEELQHPFGFVVYRSKLTKSGGNLSIPLFKDYAYVFVGEKYQGMLIDSLDDYEKRWLMIKGEIGDDLAIMIENRGRNIGNINDFKGILSNVTIDGSIMENWEHFPIPLPYLYDEVIGNLSSLIQRKIKDAKQRTVSGTPGLYAGHFNAKSQDDTFLNPQGWGKGQVFVNGFNVGRYWPSVGPQVTLYVPSSIICKRNMVLIMELTDASICSQSKCTVEFIDHPIFNFTSPTVASHFRRDDFRMKKLRDNLTSL